MLYNLRQFILLLSAAMNLLLFSGCGDQQPSPAQEPDVDPYFDEFIPQLGEQAHSFALSHDLNEDYCLLVDYALPSGHPRVFLWSFPQKKIVFQAHTMHGPGGGSTKEKAVLSNVSGSNCSAPGPFAITKEHGTINPDGFFLRGLSPENSNARQRALMLHGAYLVDAALLQEPDYLPIDATWCAGCITVSLSEMGYLHDLIMNQDKQILLWSFSSEMEEEQE